MDVDTLNKVGRWWSKDAEIDIIGLNEDDNAILFAEVKWSVNPVGIDILADLKRKASLVEWGKHGRVEHFALFSRSRFSDEMKRIAESDGVYLCSLGDVAMNSAKGFISPCELAASSAAM